MKIPKENEQYRHYDGIIYTVVTITKDPNHFCKRNVHLESSSIPFAIPLNDFNGYKKLDNGKKVKRFTKLEDKIK